MQPVVNSANIPASIAALPSRTAEFGALLERWANLNSGSGHGAGLARMAAVLRAEFAASFPQATFEQLSADAPGHNPPGAIALRFRLRPEAPLQVFLCGHYDTVYEAADAFQTCRWLDADTLNGPGVTDMKGGLITLLAALQAFEQTPHAAQVGWEILLTPDEETGTHGTRALFEEAAKRNHFGFVFEPARPSGDIIHSRKGTGGAVATCHGRAAHAAKIPNDGRNAILALAAFSLAAAKIPSELPGVLLNVANIKGGTPATNVVPDFAQAELDLRVTKMSDREPLFARLEALAAEISASHDVKFELKIWLNRPPKENHPTEAALFPAFQKAGADVGVKPFNWVHGGGASDGNFLGAAGLPCFDGIGPEGDHLHSAREYCRVPTIAPRAANVALFLHRLASGEIKMPKA
ncbi:hydrolase [Oleiharenicola lentus]|uniref:hydrolase n=1 Tax=Oleiharenicola lentus TaxID=2508720 RepID=UPI003F6769AC